MALADTAAKVVHTALNVVDSFRIDVTLNKRGSQTYDSTTDTMVNTVTPINLRVVHTSISEYEKASLYPKTPSAGYEISKIIIEAADLPSGTEPELEDSVIFPDGSEQIIIKVNSVPAKSIFIAYIARGT